MNRLTVGFAICVAVVVAGCSSASQQIVGTWKGDPLQIETPAPDKNSSDPGKSIGAAMANGLKGLINSFVGPITMEFNADGKYKMSVNVGSTTGTYSVSGNEVTLTPDPDQKSNLKITGSKLILSDDGKTLQTKKEFNSDSVLQLKKQP